MNTFFMYWVDAAAMVLSLGLALGFALFYRRRSVHRLRVVPLFFLLFGPLAIIIHMCFHNFEIVYRAVVNSLSGQFTYTFRFYSLVLMGVLVLWLSVTFLKRSVGVYVWGTHTKRDLLQTAGMIALVTLPTIPLTPIGSLPLMACLINLAASAFVRNKRVLKHFTPAPYPEGVVKASISTRA